MPYNREELDKICKSLNNEHIIPYEINSNITLIYNNNKQYKLSGHGYKYNQDDNFIEKMNQHKFIIIKMGT